MILFDLELTKRYGKRLEQTKNLPEQGASGSAYLVLSGLVVQGVAGLAVGGLVFTDEVDVLMGTIV